MSTTRERTIIAEICDVIETTPLNEPDGHGLAKKIYELVVKDALRQSMKVGIEKTHDSRINDNELEYIFHDHLIMKI